MRVSRTMRSIAILAFFLVTGGAAQAADLIRNVNIVDVESGAVKTDQDVLIRDGMIVSIEAASEKTPGELTVYDGRGGYMIPGLWDTHVHVFSSPDEYKTAFGLYLINGVTGIRDMGALLSLDEQRRIAGDVETGAIAGPHVILSGAWIDASPGSWPGMFLADTPDEGRARVKEIKAQDWAAAKSYSMLAEDTYRAIADEAKKLNIPLVGHIPESVTLETAIAAGQDGMEHFGRVTMACSTQEAAMISRVKTALNADDPRSAMIAEMAKHNRIVLDTWDPSLCDQVVAQLAAAKLAITPTLIVSDFYVGKRPAAGDPRMRTLPLAVREAWKEPDFRLDAMTDEVKTLAGRSIALDWKVFKLAHDAGVPIMAGTDASFANPYIFHGFSLLDELDRYVETGLTPREALFTATVAPVRFFKLANQDGKIAAGRRADLVILERNPLDGLGALRAPRAVIANGRILDRLMLDRLKSELEANSGR